MALSLDVVMQDYLYDTVSNLNEMDFFNRVVSFDDNPNNVATSEATFIFSGPPVLNPKKAFKSGANTLIDSTSTSAAQLGGIARYLFPIGAVQNYQLQQGRQVIPFQELGSRLKRQAVGSGQYSAAMSRVLTRHANLKYSLYGWLPGFLKAEYGDNALQLAVQPSPQYKDALAKGRPWEHFHWLGFESEIYKIPFGLLCITGASSGKAIHVEYLERCFLPSFSRSSNAGSPMIVGNTNIMVTRPRAFVDSKNKSLIPSNVFLKKNQGTASFVLQDFHATAA